MNGYTAGKRWKHAAKALLSEVKSGNFTSPQNIAPKINGEAFFLSDESPQPLFVFNRKTYAFVGHPVSEKEITVISFAVVNAITWVTEWMYWIFTLGTKEPEMSVVRLSWVNRV